jgi:PPOX class probable F420-dependent enzyme
MYTGRSDDRAILNVRDRWSIKSEASVMNSKEGQPAMSVSGLTAPVREFLSEPRYAVVATINESGMPQLTAIWYELAGDDILMNSNSERLKLRNLRRDPRLSICVVDGERYVTLYGQATLIDDQAVTQAHDYRLAVRYDGQEQADVRRPTIEAQRRIIIRMAITRVHARGFA